MGVEEPAPYGPLPAPPGPLPPDWQAAPIPTANSGTSANPAATFRVAPSSSGDVSGPITVFVLGALALLLAIGLFVVARGLSCGHPLLAPFGPVDDLSTSDDDLPRPDDAPAVEPMEHDVAPGQDDAGRQ